MSEPARVIGHTAMQPIQSEAGAIMNMIERVARDPSVDISRLERLLELRERISAQAARAAYYEALSAMQSELPVIVERGGIKNSNGKVQSTYALWEDINEAIKPVLTKHGFALSFRTGRDEGQIIVTGVLSRGGHSEETTMHLPVDKSGSKNDVQAVGSSTSYGKRYTASALLNLTSRGEDDDGKAAGGAGPINDGQLAELIALAETVGADKIAFCRWLKIDGLAMLPASQFGRAMDALKAKGAKR